MKTRFGLLGVLVHLLVMSSCGDSSNNSGQPGTAPSPSPFPVSAWSEVQDSQTPDVVTPESCSSPMVLKVMRDGSFQTAPCRANEDAGLQGKLAEDEVTHLASLADAVAGTVATEQTCEAGASHGSRELSMTFQPMGLAGPTFSVLSASTADHSTCYNGGVSNAKALASYMDVLMDKYYPRRNSEG